MQFNDIPGVGERVLGSKLKPVDSVDPQHSDTTGHGTILAGLHKVPVDDRSGRILIPHSLKRLLFVAPKEMSSSDRFQD